MVAGAAVSTSIAAPDVTLCEWYGVVQFGRVGDTVAFSGATTSWNIGSVPLEWRIAPDHRHPFITQNLYRLSPDGRRFQQIGQSWAKNGFFALSNQQCGPGHPGNIPGVPASCTPTPGNALGVGCTDTYSATTNANQTGNTGSCPRFEVDPWTGAWQATGSLLYQAVPGGDTVITRRLQVTDDDLDEPGSFFAECYYIHYQDENHLNNLAWKPVVPTGFAGQPRGLSMSGSGVYPSIGPAIDAWGGAVQTVIAQEVPVFEGASPDGRCILGAKVFSNGDGTWRYEYALANIDMDRQVGSFEIPIASGATITNAGFYAPLHHNEPTNDWPVDGGVAIDNNPWSITVGPSSIEWSTTGNPLRWGTLYNFWFDADHGPEADLAVLGHFKAGSPASVSGLTMTPTGDPAAISALIVGGAAGPIAPGLPFEIDVQVTPGTENFDSGEVLYCFDDPCMMYSSAPLMHVSGTLYRATLPAPSCGDTIRIYARIYGDGVAVVTSPDDAPMSVLEPEVGAILPFEVGFDFEDGLLPAGWATSGLWHVTDQCITGAPCDGAYWLYYGQDHSCDYDTGVKNNGDAVSGPIQLPDRPGLFLEFCHNLQRESNPNTDLAQLWINTTLVATYAGTSGWEPVVVDLGGYQGEAVAIKFAFNTVNALNNNFHGWQIDDIRITGTQLVCITPDCDGDADGNGQVDTDDLTFVILRLGTNDPNADVDASGLVDIDDITYVVLRLGNCS